MEIKYFSMFSGIGGFELGIKKAMDSMGQLQQKIPIIIRNPHRTSSQYLEISACKCIGYSEIDKYAIQIYQNHFKEHKNYGDCTRIDWKAVPDFDLLVGGFPCQAFSIAGKRGGFKDTRGTLFFEIARCLKEKQPRLFLLENVKGLLSHDKGATFLTIISTLDELGYDLQWQVLNSKNFGVPQNRERVFIIGHLRGQSRPKVFPIGENKETCPIENGNELRKQFNTLRGNQAQYSNQNFIMRDGRDNRSCLRSGRTPEIGVEGLSIRRLTPTECERLQGFPDGWTEGISDTQRYKCLGNAVTVNVIEEIIKRMFSETT